MVASSPHADEFGFAAQFGDGSNPTPGAQAMVISFGERRTALGEHRHRTFSSYPGNGAENLDGEVLTQLAILAYFLQQFFDALLYLRQLLMQQTQTRQQQQNLLGQSRSYTTSQRQR